MKDLDSRMGNLEDETLINFANKDTFSATVASGMGNIELKRGEKRRFLGQFRERIIKVLTKEQLAVNWYYTDILEAIEDQRSSKVIVKSNYRKAARKYTTYAVKNHKQVIISDNPEYIGDIVFVVAADDAVDVENITVENAVDVMRRKGVPEEFIHAGSGKLCNGHYKQINSIMNVEMHPFKKLSLLDRLAGEKCSVCMLKT